MSLVVRALLMAASIVALSCNDFSPGPDLDVEIPEDELAFQATTGDPSLCCCRIVGRVINRSTVPVHVTLRYRAFEPGLAVVGCTAI
jgi:hypothetical protein